MLSNSTTTLDNSPKSHYIKDSSGHLYLRKLVKRVVDFEGKIIPRFTTFRCLPDGSILPRLRMSKKLRRRIKLSLREEPHPTT